MRNTETLDLGSLRIEEKRIEGHLPHDVVAKNILSRLPAKTLLRFEAVCKQWSATISDPTFGHTHLLQQSKTSFIHPSNYELQRVALENDEFRELSCLEIPQPLRKMLGLKCYCDGLFLLSFYMDRGIYIVWNPSRRTYKELHYPYLVDSNFLSRIGICYNPLEKDYKVVIVVDKHYAVFSCKSNSWRKMRTDAIFSDYFHRGGVPYNDSIYWIMTGDGHTRVEILCFDGKDEKLKILCKLDYADRHDHSLFTSQNGLFLVSNRVKKSSEIVIKQILPVWTEHKLRLPFPFMRTLGFTQQNKIIFQQLSSDRICRLYDYSGRCFEDTIIQSSCKFSHLHPYIENLLLLL